MSDREYVKIPSSIFKSPEFTYIRSQQNGDKNLVIFLWLLVESDRDDTYTPMKSWEEFKVGDWAIIMQQKEIDVKNAFDFLESIAMIKVYKNKIWVNRFFASPQDMRVSGEYKRWRSSVLSRDNYMCTVCGANGESLHAHHIKPFCLHKDLIYNVDNGITLCKSCHISLHKTERGWD